MSESKIKVLVAEDEVHLGQILSNFLTGRGYALRTGVAGDDAFVDVADEGQGIAREDLTKIFEPFFTTKPPGRGTGLGLSICYAIVAEHDGRIEVDSAPGEGSVFRIILPRADETEDLT